MTIDGGYSSRRPSLHPRATFTYKPLNDWTEEIRLLQFLPQQPDTGPIEFEMKSFTLGVDCPEFSAISYRWDTSPPTSEILIDGMSFPVRNNVTALFQELRSRNDSARAQYIWIDALCINQGDVKERNHQVKLMRSIYSTASRVLAWLGPASEQSDSAIQYMQGISSGKSSQVPWRAVKSIKALLSREYWTRIWVVQELLLARDITILCGDKAIRWSVLHDSCNMFQRLLFHESIGSKKREAVEEIMATGACVLVKEKGVFGTSDTRQLSVLLDYHKFGRFKCTDIRDKVYGLLGISQERDQIVVDYRKSMEQVYIDVMMCLGTAKHIVGEFTRALASTTKNDQYRPFLARLLYILDIHDGSLRQLRRILLPLINEPVLRVLGPEHAQWITGKFFWEIRREFYWQVGLDTVSTYSWEKLEFGHERTPDDGPFVYPGTLTDWRVEASLNSMQGLSSPPVTSIRKLQEGNTLNPLKDPRGDWETPLHSLALPTNYTATPISDMPTCINLDDNLPTDQGGDPGCINTDYNLQLAENEQSPPLPSLREAAQSSNEVKENFGQIEEGCPEVKRARRDWEEDFYDLTQANVLNPDARYETGENYKEAEEDPWDWREWYACVVDLGKYADGRSPFDARELISGLLLGRLGGVDSKSVSGQTLLSWAIMDKHERTPVVQLLLARGANIEQKNKLGQALLSIAVANGHEATVKLLLQRGAEIESRDKAGQTPLFQAASTGHKAITKLLLEKGAAPDLTDNWGQTPLSWAAANGHEAIVELLLNSGAKADSKSISGNTPLSRAAANGHAAVVDLLLDAGAEADSKNVSGQTPLLLAAGNGDKAVVKRLLHKGADAHSKSISDETPLSRAAANGYGVIVNLLLRQEGANIESRDKLGQTPLSQAAENGHRAVCELLLRRGADEESKDEWDRTPILWAAANGHKGVVDLLWGRWVQQQKQLGRGATVSMTRRVGEVT